MKDLFDEDGFNKDGSRATKYDAEAYEKLKKKNENKVAVYQGCYNESCFCSGACMKIIGYKDKDTGIISDEL